jgi:hypothetical protein
MYPSLEEKRSLGRVPTATAGMHIPCAEIPSHHDVLCVRNSCKETSIANLRDFTTLRMFPIVDSMELVISLSHCSAVGVRATVER